MLLVAQRVVSPKGQRGTNAFVYRHGGYEWEHPPEPETLSGSLVQSRITVPPPGNRVVAYLDILVPDDWSIATIDAVIASFRSSRSPRLPAHHVDGRALLRFDLDRRLLAVWRGELEALYAAARELALYSGELRPV